MDASRRPELVISEPRETLARGGEHGDGGAELDGIAQRRPVPCISSASAGRSNAGDARADRRQHRLLRRTVRRGE